MINCLPALPIALLITQAQSQAAKNRVFSIAGHEPLIYRGFTPLGDAIVEHLDDVTGRGSFWLRGHDSARLAAAIATRFDATGANMTRPSHA